MVELPRQHQGGYGHGSRLGDQRAEQGADDQDEEPRGRDGIAAQCGKQIKPLLGKPQDRPGRGQRHDHHDKKRLREIHSASDIIHRRAPSPAVDAYRSHQNDRPDAKHRLDFAEQMKNLTPETHLRDFFAIIIEHDRPGARGVSCLNRAGPLPDLKRQKGVQDRGGKDYSEY